MESDYNTSLLNWISFLFGGIGTVILSLIWRLRFLILKPNITNLSEGDIVPHKTTIKGHYSRLKKNQDIWVFVYPKEAGQYYPQKAPAFKGTNGVWEAVAFFGSIPEAEIGDSFEVCVVTANFRGTQSILEYMNKCIETGNWSGMNRVPDGCKVTHNVQVVRG
jgi:hypothetical protein